VLLGASGPAISQPVLNVFGESPGTFIFHRADGADLLLFALAVALVPPVLLWAVGFGLRQARAPWGRLFHAGAVGVLLGLAAVQLLGSAPRAVALVAALVVAVGAAALVDRFAAARLWLRFLAVLPPAAIGLFLFASPAGDLFGATEFEAAATDGGDPAPIVLIVLDELPTASIIDAAGAIDPVRFPNLARLADEATWYRNATALSGWTATAVPAIFSGLDPERAVQIHTSRPDNLFRLVAGTHDLVVSEPLTRLCPTAVCGDRPRSPVDGGPEQVPADLGALFADAIDVWVERVTGSDGDLAGFQESLESPADDTPVQPTRVLDVIAALEPADRPLAVVLHVVLPHHPWQHLPDGTVYAEPAAAAELDPGGVAADPWSMAVQRQVHLLQASYADQLVGDVLAGVEEAGFYDEAVVAVTADHGIAFEPGSSGRLFHERTAAGIMWVPFIVKAPGQRDGEVDDANVETIDMLPTLAEHAGIQMPWDLDGARADSEEVAARGDAKRYFRLSSILEPRPDELLEVDGAARFAEVLGGGFPPVRPGEDPVRGLYRFTDLDEVIGTRYRPDGPAPDGSIAVDDLDRLLTEDRPVLALSGAVAADVGATHVVAALDGEIVAVSPTVVRAGDRPGFTVLLPTGRSVDLAAVELGLVRATGPTIEVLGHGAIGDGG
jgi:hypothetical protein